MSTPEPPVEPSAESASTGSAVGVAPSFAALGSGTVEDRLGFGEVLQIFVRSVPLLRPVRWHLVGLLAMVAAGAMLIVPVALLLYDAMWQGVLQGEPIRATTARLLALDPALVSMGPIEEALRTDVRNRLMVVSLGLVALFGPAFGAGYYYQLWILQRINQHLRTALVTQLQSLSLRFHSEAKVGDSIYRIYQDSSMVTNVIRTLLLDPAIAVISLLVLSVQVARNIDGLLVLVLLLGLPPSLALSYWLSSRMRAGFRAAREANSRLTSRIQETVAGLKVIKAFGAEPIEQARFEADSRDAFREAFAARYRLASYGVVLFWFSGTLVLYATLLATEATMSQATLATLGVWMGTAAATAIWDLGIYNTFKDQGGRVAQGIESLFSLWGRAQDIAIGLDRVFQVLDLQPEVREARDAVAMPSVRDKIRFDGVTFGYRPEQPILHGIDLEAQPSTITALVGPTGSGKSTLVSLLLRLYDPDEGRIEIDGVDLRSIRIQALRDNISIALQENVLFATTVRENIRYACPDATDEQVREAARVACADDFIGRLPLGYDTLLGERGSKLSTGQRQRISIARAILKDTPVLILDEPTAALDAQTESAVLEQLAGWGKGRAIFIITHRLSTIRRADQIVVLQDGRVVERGTHDAIVAREGGAYRRLFELEAGTATARSA